MSNSLLEILFTILSIIVLGIMFVIGIVIVVAIFNRSDDRAVAIENSRQFGHILNDSVGC